MSESAQSGPAALAPATPPQSGALKAALWLLSVEEATAVAALATLNQEELLRLRKAVEGMHRVAPEQLVAIHTEFNRLLEEQPLRVRGDVNYLLALTKQALGETRAAQLMPAREVLPASVVLVEANPERLATLLAQQHPQVISAVLATLPAKRARDILLLFADELRRDVVLRLARLTRVPQTALTRAQQILSAELPVGGGQEYEVDGVRLAASALNQMPPEQADEILTAFVSAELAEEVRQAMFTFEDLVNTDRRGLQSLLKEVPSEKLLVALKGARDELREKILGSLSKRASDMMREDMQVMGPVRVADVESAQQEIVGIALKLRADGKLTVQGGGDFL